MMMEMPRVASIDLKHMTVGCCFPVDGSDSILVISEGCVMLMMVLQPELDPLRICMHLSKG